MQTKKGNSFIPVLIILALLALGGYYLFQKAGGLPERQATTTDTSLSGANNNLCSIHVDATTTDYMRTNIDGWVFVEITPADELVVAVKTVDGWLGFEPGVAQAPNVGPFRLRYIKPQ